MTHTKLTAGDLASLFNWSVVRLHELARADELPIIASDSFPLFSLQDRFGSQDALMIEVARQSHDDGGIPMAVASKLVWNAGVILGFPRADGADHWIAIVRYRNSWGAAMSRGSIPVTEVGPGEYWSSAHFSGSLAEVSQSVVDQIEHTTKDNPDSDPARIFMTNVSAADRRLRQRAAELGIELS